MSLAQQNIEYTTTPRSRDVDILRSSLLPEIQKKGMIAPWLDTDTRSQKVWSIFEEAYKQELCTITFNPEFDYTKLVETDYEHMDCFQVRSNELLWERVKENKIKFFGQGAETLKKAPMNVLFKDGDRTIYASAMGNGRGYCFKEQNSKQAAFIIDCREMKLNDVLELAFEAASVSNETTSEDVEKETPADIAQQLGTHFNIQRRKNPKISITELTEKGHRFLKGKEEYKRPEHKGTRTDVINKVLENGRSEAIAPPLAEEIDAAWRSHFGMDFNQEKTENVIKINTNGYILDVERTLLGEYKRRPIGDQTPAWCCFTIGASAGKAITSVKKVEKERGNLLKRITEDWNTHAKLVYAGFPTVTKIMFLKQLASGPGYEAYEWNPDDQCFIQL